jgi:hypothetical protein
MYPSLLNIENPTDSLAAWSTVLPVDWFDAVRYDTTGRSRLQQELNFMIVAYLIRLHRLNGMKGESLFDSASLSEGQRSPSVGCAAACMSRDATIL